MREMLRDGFGAGARATSGRLSTPGWLTWSLISFGITAVSVPTLAVLYDVFVPIAFVLGILQGGSVLLAALRPWWGAAAQLAARSEEHTSELQSRENLVCRLLLEKKKTIIIGRKDV